MNRKIGLLLCIVLLLSFYPLHAEDAAEQKYIMYTFRTYQDEEKHNYQNYYLDDLKDKFIENSKKIDSKKIDNEILTFEADNSEKSKKDLKSSISDMQSSIYSLEDKEEQLTDVLDFDSMLPPTHPNKLSQLERENLEAQIDQISDSISSYEKNLDDMKKNYIMLDFKLANDNLNVEYKTVDLEHFIKTELLSIDSKVLDILEENVNKSMKENELEYMSGVLTVQKKSYELGYTDGNTIMELEKKIDLLNKDISSINNKIYSKLDELAIITGVEYIDGLIFYTYYFNEELISTDAAYYRDKFEENAYQFDLMDEQIKAMDDTEEKLRKKSKTKIDADIMNAKKRKTVIYTDSLLNEIELGAFNLISNYNAVNLEREKHLLTIEERARKNDLEKIKLDLGYISKFDYDASTFEYLQLSTSTELMNLKLVRIRLLLDSMAEGVVQK